MNLLQKYTDLLRRYKELEKKYNELINLIDEEFWGEWL